MKKYLGILVLFYLRSLARLQLLKNKKAIIVGITGSAGKTSTRQAISLVLSKRGIVKASLKANSESGIPLNILGLTMSDYSFISWLRVILLAPLKLFFNWEHYHYYVVEMGVDSPNFPKNMSYLLSILQPDVGVVLNAGLVHGENYEYLTHDRDPARRQKKIIAAIAHEKMKLAHGVRPTGFVVVNYDQKELVRESRGLKARLFTIGSNKGCRLQISKPNIGRHGFSLDFSYQNRSFSLNLPDFYEESYAYTFVAAVAVGVGLGIPVDQIVQALEGYRAPAGRMRIFSGINNSTLIDSTYNASPATMLTALKLLGKIGPKGKRIAIVGDMREIGKTSKLAHKTLAAWLKKYADQAFLFGKETGKYTAPLLNTSKFTVQHFDQMDKLILAAKSLPAGSTILLKGSQNTIFLERVTEALLANKSDSSKLCRRGKYWDQIRAKTP